MTKCLRCNKLEPVQECEFCFLCQRLWDKINDKVQAAPLQTRAKVIERFYGGEPMTKVMEAF